MNFRLNLRILGLQAHLRPNLRSQGGFSYRRWPVGGILLAVLGGFFWLGMAGRLARVVPLAPPGPEITEAFGGPLWLVAMDEKKPVRVGQPLPPAARLILESGRLQVTWPDGTIARLEGPTAWQLEDAQHSTLQDGRLLVVPSPHPASPPQQWRFPGGQAVVAAGGTLFVDVARDRTVRLAQLEGESLVFRPKQNPHRGDRPVLRLGSASQLTVRADGRWEPPTFLAPGAIARLMGSTVLLEGFGRKLTPLALREPIVPLRPTVSVRPAAPAPPPPPSAPPEPAVPSPVSEPVIPPPVSEPVVPPPPLPEPFVAAPTYRAPKPPALPLVPSSTVTLPQPQFAPPVVEPLPIESPETAPPSEPVAPEAAATETF